MGNANAYSVRKLKVFVKPYENYIPTANPTQSPVFQESNIFLPTNPTVSPSKSLAVEGIAESAGYELVYNLDIPIYPSYSDGRPEYSVDNHPSVGEFSRVAYYL